MDRKYEDSGVGGFRGVHFPNNACFWYILIEESHLSIGVFPQALGRVVGGKSSLDR